MVSYAPITSALLPCASLFCYFLIFVDLVYEVAVFLTIIECEVTSWWPCGRFGWPSIDLTNGSAMPVSTSRVFIRLRQDRTGFQTLGSASLKQDSTELSQETLDAMCHIAESQYYLITLSSYSFFLSGRARWKLAYNCEVMALYPSDPCLILVAQWMVTYCRCWSVF